HTSWPRDWSSDVCSSDLAVSGAVFIVWLILVFLFTPGINYRLARRTSIHDADFLYTIQSTCQTALHHGNAVTVYTNGEQFYPAKIGRASCRERVAGAEVG